MKISVIGSGYVGLVTSACLANLGNEVICMDIDKDKIKRLEVGDIPFYEPGLKEIVDMNIQQKRLIFTTDIKESVQKSDVIFIAVGTPQSETGEANLSAVHSVAKDIGNNLNSYKVIVDKSTVPVGTADKLKQIIRDNRSEPYDFDLVSNPEFLREGEAVNDFTLPDRIVLGVETERSKEIMMQIYRSIERTGRPILITDIKSAELIKYAANAMLASRISFMNEISQLCEKVGADIKLIAKGIGLDNRIGPRFLQAGIGYGGSCFPKDVRAMISVLKENSCNADILEAVDAVNQRQKKSVVSKVQKLVPDLNGKTVAIWGLSFKPKTDDMREAPSLTIINNLAVAGANIVCFDPVAKNVAISLLKDHKVKYAETPLEAIKDADALIIATEWDAFRDIDKEHIKQTMRSPNIIDGRNIYEPAEMKQLGFNYVGVGR